MQYMACTERSDLCHFFYIHVFEVYVQEEELSALETPFNQVNVCCIVLINAGQEHLIIIPLINKYDTNNYCL